MKNGDTVSCTRPANADGSCPWTVTGTVTIDADGVGATITDEDGCTHLVWADRCVVVQAV